MPGVLPGVPLWDGAGAAVPVGEVVVAMESSMNQRLGSRSSSISANIAPNIRTNDLCDGSVCTMRLRRSSSRFARFCTLLAYSRQLWA